MRLRAQAPPQPASAPAPLRGAPRSSASDYPWPQHSPLPPRWALPPLPPPQLPPAASLWHSQSQTERRKASHSVDMETDVSPATPAGAPALPQMLSANRFSRMSL